MLIATAARRRARLVSRHGLDPESREAASVEDVVRALVCLHATEPATVHLSVAARSRASRQDVERVLHVDRTVVKQLAMRRTLFAFPRDLLPHVWGSASARVAEQLVSRLGREVEAAGIAPDGPGWWEATAAAVLAELEGGPLPTARLRERVPPLAERLEMSPDKPYGGSIVIAPRVLAALGATAVVTRAGNEGGWRTSRPRWALTEQWLGAPVVPTGTAEGYRELVRRWLAAFGPGTTDDLVWWLGATKGAVRTALAELDAVPVGLVPDDADPTDPAGDVPVREGWVLPDDTDDLLDAGSADLADRTDAPPVAALLPVLDATVMGWKDRRFFLPDDLAPQVFDRNGNAGTTAWWQGQVVGCWVQDEGGGVHVATPHDPGPEAREALAAEARRLEEWLDGEVVSTVYPSPLMKAARAR